ncbi:MAG TPA: TIGR00730 family Rossman fold protein [Tepidisphaeraceae bacterium]|nr:TIGR00730 family Rossman fold protein [Tepidisphaeraceae bacterium]
MQPLRSVTVYCSSSRHVAPAYFDVAAQLGAAIARNGWRLVYGGNLIGCMGALADAARAAGGKVTGVTPQLLVDQGIADEKCDELVVTSGMRERKALLEERAHAFVTLPGGLGTFEEVFEIIVGRMLGYHAKPIVLLNVQGYYQPLLNMIEHGIEQRFIKPAARDAYFVAKNVTETIEFLAGNVNLKPPSSQTPNSAIE